MFYLTGENEPLNNTKKSRKLVSTTQATVFSRRVALPQTSYREGSYRGISSRWRAGSDTN